MRPRSPRPLRLSSLLALAACLALCSAGHPAEAAPDLRSGKTRIEMSERLVRGHAPVRARIVLLHGGASASQARWPEAERLIAAEFSALGLKVSSVASRRPDLDAEALAELASQASEHRALAAMRVGRSGGRDVVQLWLYDRLTGKSTHRSLSLTASGRRAASQVALQAVEMLHASLIELERAEPAAPRVEVELDLPRLMRRLARRTGRRDPSHPWAIHLAPSIAAASLQYPAVQLAIGATRRFGRRLHLGLQLRLPLHPFVVEHDRESAEVNLYHAAVVGRFGLRPQRALSFDLGLLVGALAVHSTATRVEPGHRGQSDVQLTLHGELEARACWWLRPHLALFVAATFGGALPVRVAFADREAARIDWLAGGSAGAQLRW